LEGAGGGVLMSASHVDDIKQTGASASPTYKDLQRAAVPASGPVDVAGAKGAAL
jgi:hypothetical protein